MSNLQVKYGFDGSYPKKQRSFFFVEVPPVRPAVNPHAVARPHGNRHLFERQGSLRMPQIPLKETSNVDNSAAGTNQDMFRRFNSLRLNQLPSNLARYEQSPNTFGQGMYLRITLS